MEIAKKRQEHDRRNHSKIAKRRATYYQKNKDKYAKKYQERKELLKTATAESDAKSANSEEDNQM